MPYGRRLHHVWSAGQQCIHRHLRDLCMQGMGEIRAAADRLEALPQFRAGNMWVLPLHSTVSPADQRKVLGKPLILSCRLSCELA